MSNPTPQSGAADLTWTFGDADAPGNSIVTGDIQFAFDQHGGNRERRRSTK